MIDVLSNVYSLFIIILSSSGFSEIYFHYTSIETTTSNFLLMSHVSCKCRYLQPNLSPRLFLLPMTNFCCQWQSCKRQIPTGKKKSRKYTAACLPFVATEQMFLQYVTNVPLCRLIFVECIVICNILQNFHNCVTCLNTLKIGYSNLFQ